MPHAARRIRSLRRAGTAGLLGFDLICEHESWKHRDAEYWPASERANRYVETYLPNQPSVIYNRATTLMELQQYEPAIERLERKWIEPYSRSTSSA